MSKPKKSITEKVQKEMPEFAAEVESLSVEELNARLAQCAKDADAIDQTKEGDEDLEQAQAKAHDYLAPYTEGKKAIKLKSRYIIKLINDKGAA